MMPRTLSVPLINRPSRALSAVLHVLDLGETGAGHTEHLLTVSIRSILKRAGCVRWGPWLTAIMIP